ncbi:MAG: protein kinase [Polyangiaceae bacterium]|nr:protein kinase [Polyangiaceae bacterium]
MGGGAQGNVWKATPAQEPGTPVALKLVDLHSASSADLTRARREARALANLAHPSLVRCHRTFEDSQRGILGLVLDFVDGVTAEAAIDEPRFTLAHRFAALLSVARALAFVHSSGLTHRDVKPENVLLRSDFWNFPEDPTTVKLVDFGIAAATGNRDGLTAVGDFIGTLPYLPPEAVDPTTWLVQDDGAVRDAFSFGVTAWELLVGGHPTGLPKSARVADYARAYREVGDRGTPWPPHHPLSGAWGKALAACLALDAERRPLSGRQIVELTGEALEPPQPRRRESAPIPRARPARRGPRTAPPAEHGGGKGAHGPAPIPPAPTGSFPLVDDVARLVATAAAGAVRIIRPHAGQLRMLLLLALGVVVLMLALATCEAVTGARRVFGSSPAVGGALGPTLARGNAPNLGRPRSEGWRPTGIVPELQRTDISCLTARCHQRADCYISCVMLDRPLVAVALQWFELDLEHGVVTLDENKTDNARWWRLGEGVAEALAAWKKMCGDVEPDDRVFTDDHGRPLTIERMAERCREHLQLAGIHRPDLFSTGANKGRFGTHGFRRSFVTRSLAIGMAEDWVRARSGHKSMELLRYRQSAKGLADPRVPEVDPRPHAKVAELADALA